MQELDAQATVVDPREVYGGLTTTIARSDVALALASDELPPLILDIARHGNERRDVAVRWTRDDLQRLLRDVADDPIVLTFDREPIERAFDDVEAHGLREKTVVLAVALSTAAGLAGPAMARTVPDVGGGPTRTTVVTPTDQGTSLGAPVAGVVAGAAALVIVGASFGYARHHRHPTPA